MSFCCTISPDESRYALAGGAHAELVDLKTGRELQSWPLPNGALDILAFDRSASTLRLWRVERRSGKGQPYYNDSSDDPNVLQFFEI